MIINTQNKECKYNTDDICDSTNIKSAFQVFEPPLSKCDMCEIVFIPSFKKGELIHTYTLGYYKDLETAKNIIQQICEAIKNGAETFTMPINTT